MDGVHQGLAGPVFMIEPVKIVAADLKGGNAPGRVLDPDPAQITPLGQEKRPDEDVRGLVMLGDKSSPPFVRRRGFFRRDMIEEESLRHLAGVVLKPINFPSRQRQEVDGLFFAQNPLSKKHVKVNICFKQKHICSISAIRNYAVLYYAEKI